MGILIPTNLQECFEELNKMLTVIELEEIKHRPEKDMIRFHHSLGMWMRNNWNLWSGGSLQNYFKNFGLDHPDDMSGLIFCSFYRYLKGFPLNVNEQVAYYIEYWKKNK